MVKNNTSGDDMRPAATNEGYINALNAIMRNCQDGVVESQQDSLKHSVESLVDNALNAASLQDESFKVISRWLGFLLSAEGCIYTGGLFWVNASLAIFTIPLSLMAFGGYFLHDAYSATNKNKLKALICKQIMRDLSLSIIDKRATSRGEQTSELAAVADRIQTILAKIEKNCASEAKQSITSPPDAATPLLPERELTEIVIAPYNGTGPAQSP